MGFGNNANASLGRIDEQIGHSDLCPRVQVNFRLLEVNQLPRSGDEKSGKDGQRLGDPEPYIRNTDQILSTTSGSAFEPADFQLNLGIINRRCANFPGKPKVSQVFSQFVKFRRIPFGPLGDDTGNVSFKSTWKGRADRRYRVCPFGITS